MSTEMKTLFVSKNSGKRGSKHYGISRMRLGRGDKPYLSYILGVPTSRFHDVWSPEMANYVTKLVNEKLESSYIFKFVDVDTRLEIPINDQKA